MTDINDIIVPGSPIKNETQEKIYWLKHKLWENEWKGFTGEEIDKTIHLLNELIEKENNK